ncbi:transglycosylase SLT domain-containing protein [Thiomicrorhabdus sp. zzn3]|uniref:transglycosylase SLT domain-containing protein n=1 Tax=Thiomicrorhabdus sp. zzn3 TaxID=3039775 RepID=UPI0024373AF7|nr:transglycosylase SLT domain-containing protein [Thiomicrorhabdus sp. zzn3]MDG6778175.1 transglycosylase SLT domain-containing protein [Thiomicrorhabdus sp. zzn3]
MRLNQLVDNMAFHRALPIAAPLQIQRNANSTGLSSLQGQKKTWGASSKQALTRLLAAVGVILLSFSANSFAKNSLTEPQQAFLDAYDAIKANDRPAIAKYKAQLQDYPLYPYVLYHDYRLHFDHTPTRRIVQFIKDNQNNYLGDRLYTHWLTHLGKTKQWQSYLKHYTPQESRDLQCYLARAQAQHNQLDAALKRAKTLWVSDRKLSKACRPLDALLRKHKQLTGSMIWQRIELAMKKNRLSLAKQLSKDLSRSERAMVEQWIKVYKEPQRVTDPLPKNMSPVVRKPVFIQGVKRLANREPELALNSLERFHAQYGLSNKQYNELKRSIALRSAYRYNPKASEYLQAVNGNGEATEDSLRWQAQIALKDSNWSMLLDTIELMDKEQQNETQWQYWKARALAASGDETSAKRLYRKLAKQRNFYAFLAADILKSDYQFNPDPVQPIDSATLIKKYPQLQRMQELLAIDWLTSAKREWYSLLDQLDASELHAVSILTSQWEQHSMAITTAARAQKWNDLQVRFPTPHKTPVMQSAKKHNVDPAWVYGVIRRESAFSHTIRSSAGAIGLMQLMPQTAKYIGRKIGIRKPSRQMLTEPKSNIELGSAYLSYLYKKYDGNKVLATAAYNAGPKRVDSWIPDDRSLPADQWIDSIPFTETRSYVKAVLEYTTIFKSLLNKKYDRLKDVMPPIGPTNVASKSAQ